MALTLDLFRTDYDPGTYGIRMYTSGSVVKAFNIDVLAVNNINTVASLNELTSIKLNLGSTELDYTIRSGESLNGYFHFVIEEETYNPTLFSAYEGTQITVNLFPELSDTLFLKSEYQATLNNADSNRSTGYIFDVDRSKSQLAPINLNSIISGSATPAQYQELNYSSIGLSNSRYSGAKTSFEQYGIESSVNLTLFEAAVYPITTTNDNICSQSVDQRDFVEFGFDSNTNPKKSPDTLPTASYNFAFDGYISGSIGTPASLDSNETTFTAYIKKAIIPHIGKGVFLQLTNSATVLYVQVESFTFNSTFSSTQDRYDFVVKKHIFTQSANLVGTGSSFYNINIRVGLSDVIYSFEGNKIYPQANKKFYLGLTKQILRTGNNGRVVDIQTICTV